MEGIDIEDNGEAIEEFGFEEWGYVLIHMFEQEAVFAPVIEELAVDDIDNLLEAVHEGMRSVGEYAR